MLAVGLIAIHDEKRCFDVYTKCFACQFSMKTVIIKRINIKIM